MHSCNSLIAGNATWTSSSLSNESGQITLSSAGMIVLIRFRGAKTKGKWTLMRKTKLTAGLLKFSLLLAASAIGGNFNKCTMNTDETITVGSEQLPGGKYQEGCGGSGASGE